MAEPVVYIGAELSAIAVPYTGRPVPLGLLTNVRVQKDWVTERIIEIGSYFPADIVIHGVNASFSWDRSYGPGVDLVANGLIPADQRIVDFLPFMLRLVDQNRGRNIVTLYRALANTMNLTLAGRATMAQNISGDAISVRLESEIN
jgi:hypothetical protein